ncbi:hypothetical protein [Streptomyces antimycoticus]|uniref:hypothetical protein n=1 Tax=Streptomyces antimycoticus TaxID=68175 RepID=UPI003675EBA1
MNSQQIAAVLYHAAQFDSRVRRAMNNPQQAAETLEDWTDALAHVPATRAEVRWDVAHAVRGYYEQQRENRSAQYRAIEPGDITAAWAPFRRELMNRHTDPVPDADPDDVAAYLTALRASRHAVATGQLAPAQYRAALVAASPSPTEAIAALRQTLARTRPPPHESS